MSEAVIMELKREVMTLNEANWLKIANEFNVKWQLPHCCGAFDGKHIPITKPNKSGSDFFNYKRFFSIVLMVVADANYKFVSIDVGGRGAEGDAHIFSRIKLGKMVKEDDPELNLPPNSPIMNRNLPYFFIGDDAFPLTKRLMKPFKPKRNEALTDEETIFNYRLSRARRCVENAFGILNARFRCVGRTIHCKPDNAKKIVAACCLLHNFLINQTPDTYIPNRFRDLRDENGTFVHGTWRNNENDTSNNLEFNFTGRQEEEAKTIRNILKDFVNSNVGSVPFQIRNVRIE